MFSKELLFFATIVGFTVAEVPSYIHVCGRKNPKLDECITNSVISLRKKLRTGMPELDVPATEPLYIDKIILSDMKDFHAVGTDVKITGLSNFTINSLHMDLEKMEVNIDAQFPKVTLNTMYTVTAKILIPINGKGPAVITSRNVNAKVKMPLSTIEHGGKKHLYNPWMTLNLDLKDFEIQFEAENFDKTLQEAVSQALASSHQEVLEVSKPNIEKAISEKVLQMSNMIGKHFTFDELFPDRE